MYAVPAPKIKEERIMSVYPLHPYCEGGKSLQPSSCSYTEEYAKRVCTWYLTDHICPNEHGKYNHAYRLHSHDPRTFADFMQYDIMCPRCNQRLRPIQNALDYHELALYACPNCDSKK